MTAPNATAPATAPRGLILFAHGARDARWAAPFEAVAARVRERHPGAEVRLAYLEFMAPTLAEAAAELAAAGCTRVAVLPLFLGAGGHVQRDLPRLLDALRSAHPGLAFELRGTAGESEPVLVALADVATAALGADTAAPPEARMEDAPR